MLTKPRVIIFCLAIGASVNAQTAKRITRLDKHGTCAITATAPFGIAFIVDSRITSTDSSGHIVSQAPGCKVLLPRPTVLLAGIGLEDTTGRAGHWNSLDAAAEALRTLPPNPNADQITSWSLRWAESLLAHFRLGRETPSTTGEVADILLLTKIGGKPFYRKTSVEWTGDDYIVTGNGEPDDDSSHRLGYAGACRSFVDVSGGDSGPSRRSTIRHTMSEEARFDHWGRRKNNAKSVDDLAASVYGLESVSADLDMRLEGPNAVIARPFASAQWSNGDAGWVTDFNPECKGQVGK